MANGAPDNAIEPAMGRSNTLSSRGSLDKEVGKVVRHWDEDITSVGGRCLVYWTSVCCD